MYRVASVLLVLFAGAHSFGFRQVNPAWNADATVAAMKTTFQVQGQTRSYWDFFSGFGLFTTVLVLFCAILAWELANMPADVLNRLTRVRWALAGCFDALTIVTWVYVAPTPAIFSAVIALVLALAARQDSAARAPTG
jgi:hypothetical protein